MHITFPFGDFPLPTAHFLHIHIDLVGPLPSSAGFQHYLIAVDRCTQWPEAFPLPDITSSAPISGWIARFGWKKTITTDQGHQFESQLFHCLEKLWHPSMLDKSPLRQWPSRMLTPHIKATIMCHEPASSDHGSTPFTHPPHIHPQGTPRLKTWPTMAGHHTPCFGPIMYWPKVTVCTEKKIQDYWRGKQITMSADRVKPAYILEETWHSTTTNTSNSPAQHHRAPVADATPATRALRTTSSGCSIHFPACFNAHVLFSGGRGRVMWEHPTNSEWPFPWDCPASTDLQYTVSCLPHCCSWHQLMVNL